MAFGRHSWQHPRSQAELEGWLAERPCVLDSSAAWVKQNPWVVQVALVASSIIGVALLLEQFTLLSAPAWAWPSAVLWTAGLVVESLVLRRLDPGFIPMKVPATEEHSEIDPIRRHDHPTGWCEPCGRSMPERYVSANSRATAPSPAD